MLWSLMPPRTSPRVSLGFRGEGISSHCTLSNFLPGLRAAGVLLAAGGFDADVAAADGVLVRSPRAGRVPALLGAAVRARVYGFRV